jgi:CTD small phosphatase-like protein 2
MITAGFSLLKSLSKPKRKRDGDASDSPGDPDTDSASKRARARASGDKAQGAGAGASFITSSVRKTKGKTPARTPARGGGGDGVDLRARFQSVDENETKPSKPSTRAKRGEGKSLSRTANEKGGSGEKSGMMGIFSPVFAYFGGAGPGPATRARRAAAASSSAPKKDARPAEKETKQSRRTTSESRRTTSSSARASGAAASRRKDPAAATAGSRGKSRSAVSRAGGGGVQADALDTTETKSTKVEQNDDVSSSDDDVPVARLVSPGRGARPSARPAAPREESLESDEAEETESDDAVLAASRHDAAAAYGSGASGASARGPDGGTEHDATDARGANRGTRGLKGPSGSRVNPNLAPDGSIIQNGFGKADTTLEDEYEYEDEMDETNYDEEYDPWIFIGGLPPLRACVPKNRPRLLPPKTPVHVNKNTLVLDLDETLVHSDLEQTADRSGADFSFPVHFNNQKHVVNVKKRPFLAEFMEFAARHFEVVVFTASQRVYAERLLDTLDPDAVLVKHRLYREACVLVDGNYMKDLSVIGRDLSRVVIVDNSPQAFGFQTENGVPIESWFDDPNDAQLLKLIPLLARLAASDDVRPVLRGKFNLEARVRAAEEKAEARARAEGR